MEVVVNEAGAKVTLIVERDEEQLDLLWKLVNYALTGEVNDYHRYIDEGGKPEDHIYWVADQIGNALPPLLEPEAV